MRDEPSKRKSTDTNIPDFSINSIALIDKVATPVSKGHNGVWELLLIVIVLMYFYILFISLFGDMVFVPCTTSINWIYVLANFMYSALPALVKCKATAIESEAI